MKLKTYPDVTKAWTGTRLSLPDPTVYHMLYVETNVPLLKRQIGYDQARLEKLLHAVGETMGNVSLCVPSRYGYDRALGPSRIYRSFHGLWSLWELMHRFNASKFLAISTRLAQLNQQMGEGQWVGFPLNELEALKRDVSGIIDQLTEMELDAAVVSAEELFRVLDEKADYVDNEPVRFSVQNSNMIKGFCRDTVARARDQLRSRAYLAIPLSMRDFYTQPTPLFGQKVSENFSSITYEVEEAGKCLALDRSTASAFHSIRCLEAGIRAISRCLDIPDPTKAGDRSWSNMLTAIKKELDKRWPGSSTRLSGDGRFFEEAYAALAAMQNPYRNATMHLDQKYTEEEAKHVFEIVKGFMTKLACRCDENGVPKA